MAQPSLKKRIQYAIEGFGAVLTFALFGLMPVDAASAIGGFAARQIGPRVGASKRARINLHRAMPELSDAEIERIVRGMWDNLGRVVTEYPHLQEFQVFDPNGRCEVVGDIRELCAAKKPGDSQIFFTAHYGNWEIANLAVQQAGFETTIVYRAANNPTVDRLIRDARGTAAKELVRKGSSGAKRAMAALAAGRAVGMLVDQKMNDGMAVPFFGRDAMTAAALARFALRYDSLVIPVRVERLGGVKFRVTFEDPMPLPRTGDDRADTLTFMTAVNAKIEGWIRERPDHWFWLHRRWPD